MDNPGPPGFCGRLRPHAAAPERAPGPVRQRSSVSPPKDCTALDARLMEACRQLIEPQLELFRRADALASELPVPPDATPETRFLAMLGRSG
jgi:hypothetical protein